ncbi:ABC transporter substrate-binding protein [Alsobacter sp. SYSU M60028]|uniref:ABC transporter substrate-binding protein n=1 Tax=Alsobacter ponti TaxID=2962936 RepID=A0ABT1LBQ0_9HYPH|nr:ABC transporter substrate-binding protein [Alsobacter ponti]MCP8938884.1 ABC transporter substrate-binding protein [Alsobacter ponti]
MKTAQRSGLAALALSAVLMASTGLSAKTLVYCSEGSPENFTPALNTTGTSFDAARPVYNQLVEFERGTTKVIPGLAESWTVSPDGLTITFKLRKGVKWHTVTGFKPTRDFNADDVLFSFNRQWKTDHPYYKVSGGKYDYFNDMDMPKLLKSIEKKDDYTVVMTLAEPNAPMLANLAMDFATIQSAEFAEQLLKAGKPEQFDQIPVGTGPFSFVAYQKDAVIRYKANKEFWGEKPKIDDLVYAITPDPTARYSKLKSGECHFVPYPRPADLAEMQKDPQLQVINQPGLNIAYWAFNTQKKPFDDKRVRQALNMGIDKAAIVKDVYLGAGQAAKNLIPPTLWGYNDKVQDYPYDPEKAKAMLKEAGVTTPLDIDLWYMPVQRPYNPNAKRIAEMMQADLAKLGINAKLVTYEWGEYRKRAQQGEAMTVQLGWTGDNGDPDNFFFLRGCAAARPGGQNLSKWCNKEYDDRLNKAKTLADPAARAKLYEEMQVIEHDEAPDMKIAHSIVYEVMRKGVTGYKQSPLGGHKFNGVDVQ